MSISVFMFLLSLLWSSGHRMEGNKHCHHGYLSRDYVGSKVNRALVHSIKTDDGIGGGKIEKMVEEEEFRGKKKRGEEADNRDRRGMEYRGMEKRPNRGDEVVTETRGRRGEIELRNSSC